MFERKYLDIQNRVTAYFARLRADVNGRDCTTASIIEIATTNKTSKVPTLAEAREVVPRISTSPFGVTDAFSAVQTMKNASKLIGVPISRILLTEAAAEVVNVPKSLRKKTYIVVGKIEPRLPRVVMFDDGGQAGEWGHVESEIDIEGTRRVDKQLQMGRKPFAVIEFKKQR